MSERCDEQENIEFTDEDETEDDDDQPENDAYRYDDDQEDIERYMEVIDDL